MRKPKPEHYHQTADDEGTVYWARQLALADGVDCVLNGDKSPWYWIRLPDGDLVLAVYPQEGDHSTYCETEQWRNI